MHLTKNERKDVGYTDCFAFHALAILKHLKFAHFSMKNGYFSVFVGSISHAFSCKHEMHDLLTLASSFYFQFQKLRLGNHRNPKLLRLLVF